MINNKNPDVIGQVEATQDEIDLEVLTWLNRKGFEFADYVGYIPDIFSKHKTISTKAQLLEVLKLLKDDWASVYTGNIRHRRTLGIEMSKQEREKYDRTEFMHNKRKQETLGWMYERGLKFIDETRLKEIERVQRTKINDEKSRRLKAKLEKTRDARRVERVELLESYKRRGIEVTSQMIEEMGRASYVQDRTDHEVLTWLSHKGLEFSDGIGDTQTIKTEEQFSAVAKLLKDDGIREHVKMLEDKRRYGIIVSDQDRRKFDNAASAYDGRRYETLRWLYERGL